jgi:hypothetical protein
MTRQFGQFSLTVPEQRVHTLQIASLHDTERGTTRPNLLSDSGEDASVHTANLTLYLLHQRLHARQRRLCRSQENQKQIVTLGAPNNSTAETSALPQHSITSKVPVRARKHRFDSSGSVRTCREHLVDVFESAGLVHFSGEISAPRARARKIWRGLEGSGRGGRCAGADLESNGRRDAPRAREAGRWRERWNRRRVLAVVGSSAVQQVAPRPS